MLCLERVPYVLVGAVAPGGRLKTIADALRVAFIYALHVDRSGFPVRALLLDLRRKVGNLAYGLDIALIYAFSVFEGGVHFRDGVGVAGVGPYLIATGELLRVPEGGTHRGLDEVHGRQGEDNQHEHRQRHTGPKEALGRVLHRRFEDRGKALYTPEEGYHYPQDHVGVEDHEPHPGDDECYAGDEEHLRSARHIRRCGDGGRREPQRE